MLRNLYDYIGSANLNNFWNNFFIISVQPTSLFLRISDTYNFIISTISTINEED